MMNEEKYYVYIWKDNGKEVYVGKGTNKRALDHRYAKTEFGDFYRLRIIENNPLELIISYAMSEEDAFRYEAFLITLYQNTIMNIQSGKKRFIPINLEIKKVRKTKDVVLTNAEKCARAYAKRKAAKLLKGDSK